MKRRLSQWATIIDEQRRSGETRKGFCSRHGIKFETFRHAVYRLRAAEKAGKVARSATRENRLVRVDLDAARVNIAAPAIEMIVGGVVVRLPIGTDARYVAMLIAAMRDSSC